ncbi:hypothetical protein BJ138DRAFT_355639 [Hygrophoropsis aurantiaca]|uniref:Uncharacterized protein n=1 Tax=Hygrophoropsis aurantiaca TaxID=72124 RepID=A0ACB8A5R7_9AGAM|nr:hypothetical protein BJ138DRAFT_355639 [Hygrophoropsis aurantiaca]
MQFDLALDKNQSLSIKKLQLPPGKSARYTCNLLTFILRLYLDLLLYLPTPYLYDYYWPSVYTFCLRYIHATVLIYYNFCFVLCGLFVAVFSLTYLNSILPSDHRSSTSLLSAPSRSKSHQVFIISELWVFPTFGQDTIFNFSRPGIAQRLGRGLTNISEQSGYVEMPNRTYTKCPHTDLRAVILLLFVLILDKTIEQPCI